MFLSVDTEIDSIFRPFFILCRILAVAFVLWWWCWCCFYCCCFWWIWFLRWLNYIERYWIQTENYHPSSCTGYTTWSADTWNRTKVRIAVAVRYQPHGRFCVRADNNNTTHTHTNDRRAFQCTSLTETETIGFPLSLSLAHTYRFTLFRIYVPCIGDCSIKCCVCAFFFTHAQIHTRPHSLPFSMHGRRSSIQAVSLCTLCDSTTHWESLSLFFASFTLFYISFSTHSMSAFSFIAVEMCGTRFKAFETDAMCSLPLTVLLLVLLLFRSLVFSKGKFHIHRDFWCVCVFFSLQHIKHLLTSGEHWNSIFRQWRSG